MKTQYLFITVLAILLFTGCDKKKDRIFEDSPAARLNASINDAYSALNGKKTWIFSFYPGANVEYGGFNLFPNFTTSVDVTLQADYATTTQSSTFKVYAGSGPILTFDTYNSVIHYFSLPGYYTGNSTSLGIGASDSGMKGEFEFLVLSSSQDSVVLKGRKYGNVMKMRAVASDQLATIIANYKTANTKFNTYRGFAIEVNGKTLQGVPTIATVNGTSRPNRSFTLATTPSLTVSYIATDTGIEFYKEYTIEGVKVNKLTFFAATTQYPLGYYANSNNTFKMIPRLTTTP
ncbi:DUF4302 domain-containing protein [Pedobacter jeongneungensis]|uniref:DUF4302 domain-containing protein n=1 Tax=Pedobacter jeongneungensis TaxID=947309 RepID=UPI00046A9341|nr:DUF4302 domain-containing protein [Pedobacter jeongneungensis]